MFRKLLSLLLSLLVLLTAFPFAALAESDELPPEEAAEELLPEEALPAQTMEELAETPALEEDDPYYLALTAENFPDLRLRNAIADRLQEGITLDENRVPYLSKSCVLGVTAFDFYPFYNVVRSGDYDDPYMEYTFTSLQGLELFPNLTKLDIRDRFMTSLDLSLCPGLTWVDCSRNDLTSLVISDSNQQLQVLSCAYNPLSVLDVSKAVNLTSLNASHSHLQTLTLPDTGTLTYLNLEWSHLADLTLPAGVQLTELLVNTCRLEELDVSSQTKLQKLNCANNQLHSLTLGDAGQLQNLDVSYNLLQELPLGNLSQLAYLNCANNLLRELDLTAVGNLLELRCDNNSLTALDVSGLTKLVTLTVDSQILPNQDLTATAEGFVFDLSPLVKDTSRVTLKSKNAAYDSATGRITFAAPVTSFSYTYDTGKKALPVTVQTPQRAIITFETDPEAVDALLEVYQINAQPSGATVLVAPYEPGKYYLAPGQYRYEALLTFADGQQQAYTYNVTLPETGIAPAAYRLSRTLRFTAQPKDASVISGKSITFFVNATGAKVYQWFTRTSPESDWELVNKATKASLTVTPTAADNGRQYACQIRSSVDSCMMSDPVTLTVTPNLPVITLQPKSASLVSGKTLNLTVKAKGPKLSYQWMVTPDGGETWLVVNKGNKAKLTLQKVNAAMDGLVFCCLVVNNDGFVISDPAMLQVVPNLPVVTGQPRALRVRNGKNASLTVKAKGAKSYQWEVSVDGESWVPIPGATKNKLALKKVTFDMDGNQYRCVLTNADGEVTSEAAALTVYLVPPVVTAEPKAVTVKAGKNAAFSVKAKEAKTYQWEVSTDGGSIWLAVPKATKAKLALKKVTADMSGNLYRCHITGPDGDTYSAAATLTVNP